MRTKLLYFIIAAFLILSSYFFYTSWTKPQIMTFEECARQGNPVMESFPRQCRTPDGRLLKETQVKLPSGPSSKNICSDGICLPPSCSVNKC